MWFQGGNNMNKLRLGIVGLGQRGSSLLRTLLAFSCVDIVALCDVYSDRVDSANEMVLSGRRNCPLLKDSNASSFILLFSFRFMM